MLGLGVRALLLRGRTLALALLPLVVGLLAVGIALAVAEEDLQQAYRLLGADLLVSLVLALVALVMGVNAFDDEREGGTLPLLLSVATPRWRIVAAKLVAAWLTTVLVCLPAFLGVGVLGSRAGFDAGEVWLGLALALVLGGAGYVVLFVLLSLLTRRSLLVGLAYVLVWEGALANYATALRNLSVGAYGRRLLALPWDGDPPFSVADPGPLAAVLLLLGLVAVAYALAARRLPRLDATASG